MILPSCLVGDAGKADHAGADMGAEDRVDDLEGGVLVGEQRLHSGFQIHGVLQRIGMQESDLLEGRQFVDARDQPGQAVLRVRTLSALETPSCMVRIGLICSNSPMVDMTALMRPLRRR